VELDRGGHQRHRDWHDAGDAVGDDAGALTACGATSGLLRVEPTASEPHP
jgi:hypothetical protein